MGKTPTKKTKKKTRKGFIWSVCTVWKGKLWVLSEWSKSGQLLSELCIPDWFRRWSPQTGATGMTDQTYNDCQYWMQMLSADAEWQILRIYGRVECQCWLPRPISILANKVRIAGWSSIHDECISSAAAPLPYVKFERQAKFGCQCWITFCWPEMIHPATQDIKLHDLDAVGRSWTNFVFTESVEPLFVAWLTHRVFNSLVQLANVSVSHVAPRLAWSSPCVSIQAQPFAHVAGRLQVHSQRICQRWAHWDVQIHAHDSFER